MKRKQIITLIIVAILYVCAIRWITQGVVFGVDERLVVIITGTMVMILARMAIAISDDHF